MTEEYPLPENPVAPTVVYPIRDRRAARDAARAGTAAPESFGIYRRYEVTHERAYHKALSDLIRLRSLRLREQNGFESQRRKNEEHIYKINTLKSREKIQQLNLRTAEARAFLAEERLNRLLNSKTGK